MIYDDEIVPGFGYRKVVVYDLDNIANILPEFIDAQRITFIEELKRSILERMDAAHEWKEFELASNSQVGAEKIEYVNSGAYCVESQMSEYAMLEKYIIDAIAAEAQNMGGRTA